MNLPASVKQRLLNLSRQTQVEFNVLLTKYALERFLYRLSVSRYRPQFILKGALLFGVWSQGVQRTTRDADVLSLRAPSIRRLISDFRKICEVQAPPDGIRFPAESVRAEEIRRQNILGGLGSPSSGCLARPSSLCKSTWLSAMRACRRPGRSAIRSSWIPPPPSESLCPGNHDRREIPCGSESGHEE